MIVPSLVRTCGSFVRSVEGSAGFLQFAGKQVNIFPEGQEIFWQRFGFTTFQRS